MYCLYRLYYLTMCNVHLCGVGYASSISVTKGGREGGREGGGTDHVQGVFVWCGLCIIHQCHKGREGGWEGGGVGGRRGGREEGLTMCKVCLCGVGYASSISVTKGGREGGREGGGTDHVQGVFVWCGLCIIHQCHKLFSFLLFLQIGGCCPPVQRGGRR